MEMFSTRHTSALSIHPSEVCESNFSRTCTAREDNSFNRSRRVIHVFSPMQITLSIVSIVFRLLNRFLYMDRSLLIRPLSGAPCFSWFVTRFRNTIRFSRSDRLWFFLQYMSVRDLSVAPVTHRHPQAASGRIYSLCYGFIVSDCYRLACI